MATLLFAYGFSVAGLIRPSDCCCDGDDDDDDDDVENIPSPAPFISTIGSWLSGRLAPPTPPLHTDNIVFSNSDFLHLD